MEPSELDRVRTNAQLAMEALARLGNTNIGLNRESVAWLEGFLERQRARGLNDYGAMPSVMGCFLGEAIAAATGGVWERDDTLGLGVRFKNGDWCFPLSKVDKQLQNGAEGGDSILSFYDTSLLIAVGKRA
jgi:hypothetical protein